MQAAHTLFALPSAPDYDFSRVSLLPLFSKSSMKMAPNGIGTSGEIDPQDRL